MPNHVTQRFEVRGSPEVVSRLKEFVSKDEGGDESFLDFEKILPMPKSLDIPKGSTTNDAVEIITSGEASLSSFLEAKGETMRYNHLIQQMVETLMKGGRFSSKEEIMKAALQDVIAALKEAEFEPINSAFAHQMNLELYGHADWYGWRVENWGSKWNSYSGRIVADEADYFEMIFDTAWSMPMPIYMKLIEMFPDIEIKVTYIDEGWGFAGVFTYQDGEVEDDEVECNRDSKRFCALYESLYGSPLNEEESEEDSD